MRQVRQSAATITGVVAAFPLQPWPGVLVSVALALAIGSLRIQIHDYAAVPCKVLSHASESVTATYEKIGVRTEWIGVVRHGTRSGEAVRRSDRASEDQTTPLTLIILTPKMADRGGIPEDALGLAAVAPEGTGRIAYVIFDRVRDIARQAAINEDDLLGYVMAHEIGHLLLPPGSHDNGSLMRSGWAVRDLARANVPQLEFSPLQGSQIRTSVERRQRGASAAGVAISDRSSIGHSC